MSADLDAFTLRVLVEEADETSESYNEEWGIL